MEIQGTLKLLYVGKADMKKPYKQLNFNTKTRKKSRCITKVASLAHKRVKPYLIPE